MRTEDQTCEGCKYYFRGECRRDILNPRQVRPLFDYCWLRIRENLSKTWPGVFKNTDKRG